MKKIISLSVFASVIFSAQNVPPKLDSAVKSFLNSPQAVASNLSIYVADENGKLIYEYNGNKGLSTASTQKIFTAAAALDGLGANYQYTTTASFSGNISNENLDGNLFVTSNGDPTLGSWRYDGYKPENFMQQFADALQKAHIKAVSGNLIVDDSYFDFQNTPGGWPWNDMGNYYGTGVWGVNWRENQFDIQMSGSEMISFNVGLPEVEWINDVKTSGNSDQSLIYTAPHSKVAYIQGTLPAKGITVSGAMPNPPLTFGEELKKYLASKGIIIKGKVYAVSEERIHGINLPKFPQNQIFFTYKSPTLNKIIYWFLRKSINLYGETFIKTLAKEKRNNGSFSAGIGYLKDFWSSKGINPLTINFADGSGLSPQNYVSAKAEVQAILWAKKQSWFNAYFDGFPTYNGMKMKSGTMKDVKSFAGIHNGYVFSAIVNNYQGSGSEALFKILNNLK